MSMQSICMCFFTAAPCVTLVLYPVTLQFPASQCPQFHTLSSHHPVVSFPLPLFLPAIQIPCIHLLPLYTPKSLYSPLTPSAHFFFLSLRERAHFFFNLFSHLCSSPPGALLSHFSSPWHCISLLPSCSTMKSVSSWVVLGASVTRWHQAEPKHLCYPTRPEPDSEGYAAV